MTMNTLKRAAELARGYNWPAEAKAILAGEVPDGFGTEVGKTVALFLRGGILMTEKERADNRRHAERLAELRFLIAKIRLARRVVREIILENAADPLTLS